MSLTRVALVLTLFLTPWVALAGIGLYHLWEHGWSYAVGWPLLACMALSYFLAWRWTRRGAKLLPPVDVPPPDYWTDRDNLAWEKVRAKAATYERVTTEQLADPKHYADIAIDLAQQVGAVYNPEAGPDRAFDLLTLPEVLTCVELAAADLNEMVQKYVPASHLLRIRDARRARQASEWYKTGQNLWWAGAAVLNPIDTAARFIASRSILGGLFDRLQSNVILWFHTAFIHQLGHYLVELNSGRLRVGVKRYRELMAAHQEPKAEPTPAEAAPTPNGTAPASKPIGIAILGAVKAGKSSLINAVLGKSTAVVDALPVAHVGVKYNVMLPGGQPVTLLDTSGYGQDGPNEIEFGAAVEASQQADLIVLVTPATNPGRKPDVDLLDRLKTWFADRTRLKLPPVVAVVTHIDLLTPKAEWKPPYNWRNGTRVKETNIRECVAVAKEQFGSRVEDVVPVCGRSGEAFGIAEDFIPAVAAQLDDARAAAVLKAFDAEGSADQYRRLGKQIVEGGKQALSVIWEKLKK